MKNVLVLGGTLFFGKRLVQRLLANGYAVTVATRGRADDPFGNAVERVVLDRENAQQMAEALGDTHFDVVYDQICYAPNEAFGAIEVFSNRVGRYIMTSSMAVYQGNEAAWQESGFDPYSYPIRMGGRNHFDYGEGKRLAESVFFQQAPFPVTAVRFPNVVGPDDYTGRVEFHLERIRNKVPIGFLNLEAKTCLINSEEAAAFLYWLADADLVGPVNACATGSMSWREFFDLLETVAGRQAVIQPETSEVNVSPYSQATSRYMDTGKAQRAGFTFSYLMEWLPGLVRGLDGSDTRAFISSIEYQH